VLSKEEPDLSFVEWVQVVTQIVTTGIALIGIWLAYQTLLRTPIQEPEPMGPEVTEAEALVPSEVKVFETKDQTTRLKVTDKGLECYLDDRRPEKPGGHQWTLTASQSKAILSKRDYRVYPGYKLHTGVFSIGPRRNWLYSKKLYPEPELLELDIQRLLEKASI
jgi:hypothetical protein